MHTNSWIDLNALKDDNGYELIPNYDPSEGANAEKWNKMVGKRRFCSLLSSIIGYLSFVLSSACFFVAFYYYLYRVSEKGLWYALWTDLGFLFGVTGLLLLYSGTEQEMLADGNVVRPLCVCFFISLFACVYCGMYGSVVLLIWCSALQVQIGADSSHVVPLFLIFHHHLSPHLPQLPSEQDE